MKKIWMQRLKMSENDMRGKITNVVDPDHRQCPSKKDSSMTKITMDSPEARRLTEMIRKTNFDEKFSCRYWRIDHVELVKNDRLKKKYDVFKDELKTLGRKLEDLDDVLVFTAETDKSCREISVEGRKVCLRKRHVLGYTGSGVHLVRNFDILSRYMAYQQYSSPAYIMVYKAFLGKAKPIVPRLHKDDNYVSPWSGFDCHVSARKIDPDMPICEALNCSYVYFYEYDDISSNTVTFPRQILPYAVLRLTRRHTLGMESPFLAFGRDHLLLSVEVKGETRRGFRFTYPHDYKKMKHKKQNIEKHRLIKTSLKEQLLEMRTKGDKRSIPPSLEKSQTECKEKVRNWNDRLEHLSPPTLLKCDSVTVNFKGEKFCVSPTVRNKKMELNYGENHQHAKIENAIVDKGDKFQENSKIRRLPLSMKPFVSVKRLRRNSLQRIRNKLDSKQNHTIEVKKKQKVPESELNGLDVNPNTEFQHKVIEKCEKSSNNKEVSSIQNIKKKTVYFETFIENTCNSSRKDDRLGDKHSPHESLSALKENRKNSHQSLQECDIRSQYKHNTDLGIPSKATDFKSNGLPLSLTVHYLNNSDTVDESKNSHEKEEINSHPWSITKKDKIVAGNVGKADTLKPKSKSVEKETKLQSSPHKHDDRHTSPMKIMPSADQNEPEKNSDPEKRIDKLSSNKECGVAKFKKNRRQLNPKDQSQHLKYQQRHHETGVKSNHTQIDRIQEVARRSEAGNSDFSKKIMHSSETIEHKDQNEKNGSKKTNMHHAVVANSKSYPFHPGISLIESILIPRGLETNPIKSNHFSASTTFIKGRDKEHGAHEKIRCMKSIDPETSKDIHGKAEKLKPKTIKDLFQEPLRNQLLEKMKSNPKLESLRMPFDIKMISHSGLAKTASPPAGKVAPVQLDCSPTVASAKVSSSPITAFHISESIDRNICNNDQRKWKIDKKYKAKIMNTYSISETGYNYAKYTPSIQKEKHRQTDPLYFPAKFQDCQYKPMDKEHIKNSLPLDKIQIQNRKPIDGGERLANVCLFTSLSHKHQQNLQFPVNQANMGIRMSPSFNISNLIHDEQTKSEESIFPTPENVLSCYKQKPTLSPRDPRVKINELQENEIETPHPSTICSKQLRYITPPIVVKKPDESIKVSLFNPCKQAVSPQKDNKKVINKQSSHKSNLVIDQQTAEKLKCVLRKHICEVKKHSIPKTPDESASSECLTKMQIVTSSIYQTEQTLLQGTDIMCDKEVNVNIKEGEIYNLHLLASQTVEESGGKNSNINNRTNQDGEDTKKNIDDALLPSATDRQQNCFTEQFDNDSQDTVIGGLELSPSRVDNIIENPNMTFAESFNKSLVRNDTSDYSKCDLSKTTTKNNAGLPALKSAHCDKELSDNSIIASVKQCRSLEKAKSCLDSHRRDSKTDKSDNNNYCASVNLENHQIKECLPSGGQSETVYKKINEQTESGEIVHQNPFEGQKIDNDICSVKHTSSNKFVYHKFPSNDEEKTEDSIDVEDIERERKSVEEEIEVMTTKQLFTHKDKPNKHKLDENELERKKVAVTNAVTNVDTSENIDVQIKNCFNSEIEKVVENILNETRDSNIENKCEHKDVSDDDEDKGPPDLTKGCCSNIFGNIHRLRNNDFACGQSPRAYRSAIIDTLQELSSVLRSLNESSLNRFHNNCPSPKNDENSDSSIDMAKTRQEGKDIMKTDFDSFEDKKMDEESLTEVENANLNSIVSSHMKIIEVKSVEHNESVLRSQHFIPFHGVKTEKGENVECNHSKIILDEASPNQIKAKHSISHLISSIKLEEEEPSCFTKEAGIKHTTVNNDQQLRINKESVNEKNLQLNEHISCEEKKDNKEVLTLDETITGHNCNELSDTIEIENIQRLSEHITLIGSNETIQAEIQTSVTQNQALDSTSDVPIANEMNVSTDNTNETKLELSSTLNPLKDYEGNQENFVNRKFCLKEKNVDEKTSINGLRPISEYNGLRKGLDTQNLPTPMVLMRNEKNIESFLESDKGNKDTPVASGTTQTLGPNQSSKTLSKLLKTDKPNLEDKYCLPQMEQMSDINKSSELSLIDQSSNTSPVIEICQSAEKLEELLEDCVDDISMANMSETNVDSSETVLTANCRSFSISENGHIQENLSVVEDLNIHNNDTTVLPELTQASESSNISKIYIAEKRPLSNPSPPYCLNAERNVVKERRICDSKKVDHTRDTSNGRQISDLQCSFKTSNTNLPETKNPEEKIKEKEEQFINNRSIKSIIHLPNMKQDVRKHDLIERPNIKVNPAADLKLLSDKSNVEHTCEQLCSDQRGANSKNIEILSKDGHKTTCLEKVITTESRKKVPRRDRFLERIGKKHVKNAQSTQSVTFEPNSNKEKEPDTIDPSREFTKNSISTIHQPKTNKSIALLKTKSTLRTNTKIANGIKEKAGILNRGMRERKNMFDTRLNIQRMRAKLTSPLITNVTVEVHDTSSPPKKTDQCLPKECDALRVKIDSFSLGTVLQDKPKTEMSDFQNKCQKSTTKQLSRDSSHESQSPELASSVKKIYCNEEIQNAKQEEMNNYLELRVRSAIEAQQDIERNTEKIKKRNIIPFHTVMRKKKEQYLKYKHGFARNKFINDTEFRDELRGNKYTTNDAYQRSSNKKILNSSNRNFISHINKQSKQAKSFASQLQVHIQSNQKPIVSERGTKLYEDTYESDICENVNLNNGSHIKIVEDETQCESQDSQEQLAFKCKRNEKHSIDGNVSYSSSHALHKYRHPQILNKRPLVLQHKTSPFYSAGSFRSFGFNYGKSGYFSWRRKYKNGTRSFGNERIYITRKGVVQTEEEHQEWKMFKERERIRVQIEEAVKDYRRTFENSSDDVEGDAKVSKYLQSLTDKLDHIQNKRRLLHIPEQRTTPYQKARDDYEEVTPSIKEKREQVEVKRLVSIDNIKGQFESFLKSSKESDKDASLGDVLWREHEGTQDQSEVIEAMLKEHLLKHLDNVTEKLKLELFAQLASEHLASDKTQKRQPSETNQGQEIISKIVEKQLDSIRYPKKLTNEVGHTEVQNKYTTGRALDDNEISDFYESDRLKSMYLTLRNYDKNMSKSTLSMSSAENRTNHSKLRGAIRRLDLHSSHNRKRSYSGEHEKSRSPTNSPKRREVNKFYYHRKNDLKVYRNYSKRSRSRTRSRSREANRRWNGSPEYKSSESYYKKRKRSKSSSHSRTRSRSQSCEKQTSKKNHRVLENDEDQCSTQCNFNEGSSKGDLSCVPEKFNTLSKDTFDRYIKNAVKSKWDNTTEEEASNDVRRIKIDLTFKDQFVSRNGARINDSNRKPDKRLNTQKVKDFLRKQEQQNTPFRHESTTDCDVSVEESNHDDSSRDRTKWNKFDRTADSFEHKKIFRYRGRYSWGQNRNEKSFTMGFSNCRGRFQRNMNYSRGSWHHFDKRYHQETRYNREDDRFRDSYKDKRSDRVNKRQTFKWDENGLGYDYQGEYDNWYNRDRGHHYQMRYGHKQYRHNNSKYHHKRPCEEDRKLFDEQVYDSEEVAEKGEQMMINDFSSSCLNSFQRSYRHESDSEAISLSPKTIPTICRR